MVGVVVVGMLEEGGVELGGHQRTTRPVKRLPPAAA
jgi:hypothetical protein